MAPSKPAGHLDCTLAPHCPNGKVCGWIVCKVHGLIISKRKGATLNAEIPWKGLPNR